MVRRNLERFERDTVVCLRYHDAQSNGSTARSDISSS